MHLFVVNYEIILPIRGLSILTEGDFRPLKPQKVKLEGVTMKSMSNVRWRKSLNETPHVPAGGSVDGVGRKIGCEDEG